MDNMEEDKKESVFDMVTKHPWHQPTPEQIDEKKLQDEVEEAAKIYRQFQRDYARSVIPKVLEQTKRAAESMKSPAFKPYEVSLVGPRPKPKKKPLSRGEKISIWVAVILAIVTGIAVPVIIAILD